MEWFGGKSRVKPEFLERRQAVAELWNRENLSTYQTAQRLEISQSTVVRDRRWLLDLWQSIVNADISDMVGREIEKNARIEAEAWKGWEKSWRDKQKKKRVRGACNAKDCDDEFETFTDEEEGRLPDPRYLEIILKCQAERCKLLGLYQSVSLTDMSFEFGAMVKDGYEKALEQRAKAKAAGNGS